jgi:DNA-binding NarL/FixJ family response regulator
MAQRDLPQGKAGRSQNWRARKSHMDTELRILLLRAQCLSPANIVEPAVPLTVLVADDHAIVREGLVALLASQPNIEVVGTAADGRGTLREALRCAPQAVVMDIAMPDMNGIEATRELRDRLPDVRVVILSMHSSVEYVFHALEAGASAYLLKESAAQEIADAVRAVCRGRRYLSSKIAEVVAEGIGRGSAASPLESLSKRERQVLQLVAEGGSSAGIAAMLALSPKSVDTYRSRIMQKLHIGDVAGLVKFAIQHGLTPLE